MFQGLFRYWRERLMKKYRVEILDNETLYQTRLLFYRPIRGVLLVSGIGLGLIVATVCAVFYIPFIRNMVPGYLNPEIKQQQTELSEKVKMLGEQIEARDSMIKTLQFSLLEGESPIGPLAPIEDSQIETANRSVLNEETSPQNEKTIAYEEVEAKPLAVSAEQSGAMFSPLINLFNPVFKGRISNIFDVKNHHYGIDIVAKENEPVRAAAEGFVIMAEYHEANGFVIGILSKDQVLTFFKHNSTLSKKVGDFVLAGEVIGIMGNSGENSTGPHLHFELWHKGIPLDPQLYLSFN